ncbi:MAG: ACP S-malonyltransferase [Oscillospiraceae bacterium]|nr:ACP S-malonyltransferase [Oscillospiraceae bacterium]
MKKIAFLFTGQGSQFVNMGQNLYEKYEPFKNIFDIASKKLNINLIDICKDEKELKKTNNAQAAIFAMSYAIFKLLKNENIKPNAMAGFSLGEITALAASEIINFEDALELISIRGETMQKACEQNPGAMYSIIGAEEKQIEEVCETISQSHGYVTTANYNCPGQTVISGEIETANMAAKMLSEKKFRTIKLDVAGAFHSKLMETDHSKLIEYIKTLNFKKPIYEIYSNMTGKKFEFGENIKSFMIDYIPKHIISPVKFKTELENMNSDGYNTFVEIGAGRVLSGFVKKTCENAMIINICDCATFEAALETLKNVSRETF